MGPQAILLIFLGLSSIHMVFGELWEFGSDNLPTAVVITQYKGEFSFLQKEQHIQLIVPQCHAVTYVKVQVDNRISSPTVYFNYETRIVSLHYNFWQFSPSTFTITAKAVWKLGCYIESKGPVPAPVQVQNSQNPQNLKNPHGPQIHFPQHSNRFQENPAPQIEQTPEDPPSQQYQQDP